MMAAMKAVKAIRRRFTAILLGDRSATAVPKTRSCAFGLLYQQNDGESASEQRAGVTASRQPRTARGGESTEMYGRLGLDEAEGWGLGGRGGALLAVCTHG